MLQDPCAYVASSVPNVGTSWRGFLVYTPIALVLGRSGDGGCMMIALEGPDTAGPRTMSILDFVS